MSSLRTIQVTINGRPQRHDVEPRQHLVDFLRERLELTGSHLGCEHGVCGACTVKVDGEIVRGCLVLAVQTDGKSVQTIEGLSESGAMLDLQEAFLKHNAMQCGFCSSGMLMAASELIVNLPDASREEVRTWISGNYCRCTGYQAIVNAICDVLQSRRDASRNETAGASA